MGKLKSGAKKTRQQRLASLNRQLLDQLNRVEREAGRFEKALLEYAQESNWCITPRSTDGQETTHTAVEWVGTLPGPWLAQQALNPPKPAMPNPDSGTSVVQSAVEASEVIVASEGEISAWPECSGCGGKINPDYGKCIGCSKGAE